MLGRRQLLEGLGLVALSRGAVGCSAREGGVVTADEEIVDVRHTDVERQSIGNCWLYAYASWAESLHLRATNESFDVSESYLTYWHWFDQITRSAPDAVDEGGEMDVAIDLARRYGIVHEKDFVPADARDEMSTRQEKALEKIGLALKEGTLGDKSARRDPRRVRRELDDAWGLSAEVRAMLDRAFGQDAGKTFATRDRSGGAPGILRAEDFAVEYTDGATGAPKRTSLAQAAREWSIRWTPSQAERRPGLYRAAQRALHAREPVVIAWFVDFNALENRSNPRRGSFNMTTLKEYGAGDQGWHITVLEDYQATLGDGHVLRAGRTLDPAKPEHARLLARALEKDTRIDFLRIKNSWGSARDDRAMVPDMPGYHDLALDYLEGPIGLCTEKNGYTTSSCGRKIRPLGYVMLPPGY